jgi:hypothetical protein
MLGHGEARRPDLGLVERCNASGPERHRAAATCGETALQLHSTVGTVAVVPDPVGWRGRLNHALRI